MKSIIIDDDPAARLIVSQLCSQIDEISVEEEFSNAIDAIKFLHTNTVDVIFLDIHMPALSGLDFIRTLQNPPQIILTTSDKNFALEAFEFKTVVDYLIKPIEKSRFRKAIDKLLILRGEEPIKKEKKELPAELFVNVNKRLIKLKYNDINFINSKKDYIEINTNDNSYLVLSSLKKIKSKLPEDVFLQVHRSYIINLSKIIDIQDNSVLIGTDLIPVSKSFKKDLMETLNRL